MSTERALRALARQVGGLSDRLGGALEDLAIETVPALLAAAWGLSDIERRRDLLQVDGVVGELDLVLRAKLPSGAPLAVLGEVSARLTRNEVDELLRSARHLARAFAPAEVRVLVSGPQCNRDARDLIRLAGGAAGAPSAHDDAHASGTRPR